MFYFANTKEERSYVRGDQRTKYSVLSVIYKWILSVSSDLLRAILLAQESVGSIDV